MGFEGPGQGELGEGAVWEKVALGGCEEFTGGTLWQESGNSGESEVRLMCLLTCWHLKDALF